jgi:hypothetical protein
MRSQHIYFPGARFQLRVVNQRYMETSTGNVEIVCGVQERVLKVSAAFYCKVAFCSTMEEQSWQNSLVTADSAASQFPHILSTIRLLHSWLKAGPSLREFSDHEFWAATTLFGHPGDFTAVEKGGFLTQDASLILVRRLLAHICDAFKKPWLYGRVDGNGMVAALFAFRKVANDPHLFNVSERIFRSMVGKRSVFTTEYGEVGSGPLWMKAEDKIAYIVGVQIPMAL